MNKKVLSLILAFLMIIGSSSTIFATPIELVNEKDLPEVKAEEMDIEVEETEEDEVSIQEKLVQLKESLKDIGLTGDPSYNIEVRELVNAELVNLELDPKDFKIEIDPFNADGNKRVQVFHKDSSAAIGFYLRKALPVVDEPTEKEIQDKLIQLKASLKDVGLRGEPSYNIEVRELVNAELVNLELDPKDFTITIDPFNDEGNKRVQVFHKGSSAAIGFYLRKGEPVDLAYVKSVTHDVGSNGDFYRLSEWGNLPEVNSRGHFYKLNFKFKDGSEHLTVGNPVGIKRVYIYNKREAEEIENFDVIIFEAKGQFGPYEEILTIEDVPFEGPNEERRAIYKAAQAVGKAERAKNAGNLEDAKMYLEEARPIVNALPDGEDKDGLLVRIQRVQDWIDEQEGDGELEQAIQVAEEAIAALPSLEDIRIEDKEAVLEAIALVDLAKALDPNAVIEGEELLAELLEKIEYLEEEANDNYFFASISMESPEPRATLTESEVLFQGTVSGIKYLEKVLIGGEEAATEYDEINDLYRFSKTLILEDAYHQIRVEAISQSGKNSNFIRPFYVDTTPPELTVTPVGVDENGETSLDSVELKINVKDNFGSIVLYEYYDSWYEKFGDIYNMPVDETITYDLDLDVGENTIVFRLQDAAGWWAEDVEVTITRIEEEEVKLGNVQISLMKDASDRIDFDLIKDSFYIENKATGERFSEGNYFSSNLKNIYQIKNVPVGEYTIHYELPEELSTKKLQLGSAYKETDYDAETNPLVVEELGNKNYNYVKITIKAEVLLKEVKEIDLTLPKDMTLEEFREIRPNKGIIIDENDVEHEVDVTFNPRPYEWDTGKEKGSVRIQSQRSVDLPLYVSNTDPAMATWMYLNITFEDPAMAEARQAVEEYEAKVDTKDKVLELISNEELAREVSELFTPTVNKVNILAESEEKNELLERVDMAHSKAVAAGTVKALQVAAENLTEENLGQAKIKLSNARTNAKNLEDGEIKDALFELIEIEGAKILAFEEELGEKDQDAIDVEKAKEELEFSPQRWNTIFKPAHDNGVSFQLDVSNIENNKKTGIFGIDGDAILRNRNIRVIRRINGLFGRGSETFTFHMTVTISKGSATDTKLFLVTVPRRGNISFIEK